MKLKSISIFILSFILSLILSTKIFIPSVSASLNNSALKTYLPCSCDDSNDPACEMEHKRHTKNELKFWSKENIKLLSEEQQSKLSQLQEKINKGECLSDKDKKEMLILKDTVAKCKLGEKDFKIFKELMKKNNSGENLTESEYNQLKDYLEKIIIK